MKRVPNVQNGCKPFFSVYKVNGLINELKFDNQNQPDQVRHYNNSQEEEIDIEIKTMVPLCGSMLVVFKHRGMMGDSNLFRVSFHTGFIGNSNTLTCTRKQISPEDVQKDFKTFPADFSVTFTFHDFCQPKIDKIGACQVPPCSPAVTHLDDICQDCLSVKDMK